MWKTNKWVPEWVIRHAIAHLHQAPSALQVCLLQEQKIRRVESQSRRVRQSQRVTDRRETTTLRYWTCSALSNTIIPAPHSLPLYLQTENLKSFTVILLWDCCRFFKSQRHFFFLSLFNGCLTNICCCNYFYEHGWLLLLHSSPWSLHSIHAGILTFLECSQHASVSGPLQ